jgi:hypothetical protein
LILSPLRLPISPPGRFRRPASRRRLAATLPGRATVIDIVAGRFAAPFNSHVMQPCSPSIALLAMPSGQQILLNIQQVRLF